MDLSHIPQYSIQSRNVHISVLNGALWDMEQVHPGIGEIGLLRTHTGSMCSRVDWWNKTTAGPHPMNAF